jgi:hypothetical protein
MAQKPSKIREFQKRFPDEDSCLTHLMRTRFGERFTCFKCQKQATYYRVKNRRSFECEHCGYQVYPTAGTPFEKTRTSLRDWFYVMFLFCETRNGVAAKEVQRQLGVTYKTAWRMCHLIRLYMGYVDGDYPMGGPGKIVEADETFIGGRTNWVRVTRRLSWASLSVMAMSLSHIVRFVKEGSRVHTDEASNFKLLKEKYGYDHEAVDHSAKEYVRGDVHTNSIESFWSQVKRGINGTYVWVSKKHLQLYLREFEYRHNLRKQPALMFEFLLQAFPKVRVE